MTGSTEVWGALEQLLRTDSRDIGCAPTWELIHRYCELVIAGVDPEVELPGVVAHLRACGPCAYDAQGLLELVLLDDPST